MKCYKCRKEINGQFEVFVDKFGNYLCKECYNVRVKNNLGCGKEFNMKTSRGFICGVPDGNGAEHFCEYCMASLRGQWRRESDEMWEKRNKYLNEKHFQNTTKMEDKK